MPHLAHLRQMLEKDGDLLSESSPRSWYLVGIFTIHSNCIYILSLVLSVFGILCKFQISLSPCHTLHDREILCPVCFIRYSPLIPHQALGIGGRACH